MAFGDWSVVLCCIESPKYFCAPDGNIYVHCSVREWEELLYLVTFHKFDPHESDAAWQMDIGLTYNLVHPSTFGIDYKLTDWIWLTNFCLGVSRSHDDMEQRRWLHWSGHFGLQLWSNSLWIELVCERRHGWSLWQDCHVAVRRLQAGRGHTKGSQNGLPRQCL